MPRRPKKRCARRGQNARTDPLVDPGNPAHREPHGPASDPGNSNHRLVNLEKSPSSRSKARAYATQIATVMLGAIHIPLAALAKARSAETSAIAAVLAFAFWKERSAKGGERPFAACWSKVSSADEGAVRCGINERPLLPLGYTHLEHRLETRPRVSASPQRDRSAPTSRHAPFLPRSRSRRQRGAGSACRQTLLAAFPRCTCFPRGAARRCRR